MFFEMIKFEMKQRMTKISTYVYFTLFFALCFFLVMALGGFFKDINVTLQMGSQGSVFVNAPYAVYILITLLSHFGILITAAIFGNSAYRDFEDNTFTLFFSYPMKKRDYLLGKYIGCFIIVILIFSSFGLGSFLASLIPGMKPNKFGPLNIYSYIHPYFIAIIPNVIFTGSIFFAVSLLKRKIFPVYITAIALFMGYLISANLMINISNETIAALIDPFGISAVGVTTKTWSTFDKNNMLIPLNGVFLANRILWLIIGIGIFLMTAIKFKFQYQITDKKIKEKKIDIKQEMKPHIKSELKPLSIIYNQKLYLKQMLFLMMIEFKSIIKNIYFRVILLMAFLFVMFVGFKSIGMLDNAQSYPVTYSVFDLTGGIFSIFIIIVITFFSGELTWRDRRLKFHQIFDAMPFPDWVPFIAKLGALILTAAVMLCVLIFSGMLLQLSKGYTNFEPGLYFTYYFGFNFISLILFCVLAMVLQIIINSKFPAYFAMIFYYFFFFFGSALGFKHNLYMFNAAPYVKYSDMNGYGHFASGYFTFKFYWALFSTLLIITGILFWVRGNNNEIRKRLSIAKLRFSKELKVAAALCISLFMLTGMYIFFNTNILNEYITDSEEENLRYKYEKTYSKYADLVQPWIIDVKIKADLYPHLKKAVFKGTYELENTSEEQIENLFVDINEFAHIKSMTLDSAEKTLEDRKLNVILFKLNKPLKPGEKRNFSFEIEYQQKGFVNNNPPHSIVDNGTLMRSKIFLPNIGYNYFNEIDDPVKRKDKKLGRENHYFPYDDPKGSMFNYLSRQSSLINFDAVISTAPDQTAVTCGKLIKSWNENDRNYFHYKMKNMRNFYAFLSARYEIKKQKHNGVDIEVYYHKSHDYNVDYFIEASKKSLDYYTKNFGPYQYDIVRIVEFPRYEHLAQALPGLIPYSESVGFIAKVSDKTVDYPLWVTAHEIGHEYWAHQVIGGHIPGLNMITEIMAQYSSLMVLKQKFNLKEMSDNLLYDRNKYFGRRGKDSIGERPLKYVQSQPHLYYFKGNLAMNTLVNYIGEDNLNRALSKFLRDYKFKNPPFPKSGDLISYIKDETPDEMKYLIEDLFETITLYDNKTINASVMKNKDGTYAVTIDASFIKYRADKHGKETAIALNDLVDICVVGEKGKVLYRVRKKIDKNNMRFELTVKELPKKAGIDMYNFLIDKNLEDNMIKVNEVQDDKILSQSKKKRRV